MVVFFDKTCEVGMMCGTVEKPDSGMEVNSGGV